MPTKGSSAQGVPADAACKKLAALAVTALLEEAALFPKPGLVDPVSQGAHTDMDFSTLVRSAAALQQGFYECACIGSASAAQEQSLPSTPTQLDAAIPASAVRKQLQHAGLALEHAMFTATKGINTHKGAIFLFAYLLGAAGRLLRSPGGGQHPLTAELCAEVRTLAAGSVAEWRVQLSSKQAYTHGEQMFLQHGCCGIRGEVEAGLPLVERYATYLTNLRSNTRQLPQRDVYLYTLLGIIAENEDTNVLFRAGRAALTDLQTRCAAITASGVTGSALHHAVEELDAYCIERHISPGGSADIFAAVIFCRSLEELYPLISIETTHISILQIIRKTSCNSFAF